MRRVTWVLAVVMCVVLVTVGCGAKNAEQVVKDLDHVISKLDSYSGAGKMTLQTGQQAQAYDVEVWYKAPYYYRIALTNATKDITQIVLRNDDGVFVLTPHLNKMFRFQSDWPENSGQVYLYQSLIQSIVMDNERQFTEEKDAYVFDVVANYQNGLLSRQKIWLNKKNYAPQQVKVADENNNVMVSVHFSDFQFDKKFDKDNFDMQRNMTSASLKSLPTMAKPTATKDGKAAAAANAQSFGIIEPFYTPAGVKVQGPQEIKLGEEKAVMFRYNGKYNYTLVESRPQAKTVSAPSGEILDLGYTIGVVTGEEKGFKTLHWMFEGVEFKLSTGDLPVKEMIKVAQSVQGQVGK